MFDDSKRGEGYLSTGYECTGIPQKFSRVGVYSDTGPDLIRSHSAAVLCDAPDSGAWTSGLPMVLEGSYYPKTGEDEYYDIIFKHASLSPNRFSQKMALQRFHAHYPDYFVAMYWTEDGKTFQGYVINKPGISLAQYIKKFKDRWLEDPLAQSFLAEALIRAVFDFQQRAGLIHGDIKPENIGVVVDRATPKVQRIYLIDVENTKMVEERPGFSLEQVTTGFYPLCLIEGMHIQAHPYLDRYALAVTLLTLFDETLYQAVAIYHTLEEQALLAKLTESVFKNHPLAIMTRALIKDKECTYTVDQLLALTDRAASHCCVIC